MFAKKRKKIIENCKFFRYQLLKIIKMPNLDTTLQINFLNKIKELLPISSSFVDELAEILDVSNDSVYRRIRGDTALTINEVATLCEHFNISFDFFTKTSENVSFSYNIQRDIEGFKNYLKSIIFALERINKSKNNFITYAAIDIPIFHNFNFDELGSFKLFYWMKAIVEEANIQSSKFKANIVNQDIKDLWKNAYNLYCNTPSAEIWTDKTITSLIKQIEFFWDSGIFESKELALTVCKQAIESIQLIEKQAGLGNKNINNPESEKSKFYFYLSDIEIGNNCILTKQEDNFMAFLSFNTFNSLTTTNQKFAKEIKIWQDNLIKKATLVSGVAERHRYQFFKNGIEKLNELYNKILNY